MTDIYDKKKIMGKNMWKCVLRVLGSVGKSIMFGQAEYFIDVRFSTEPISSNRKEWL